MDADLNKVAVNSVPWLLATGSPDGIAKTRDVEDEDELESEYRMGLGTFLGDGETSKLKIVGLYLRFAGAGVV